MAETIVSLLIENTAIFAVLLAAVWLIKTVFKKQLTAQPQYLIWCVVVLKLLIPFSVTTQWSPYVLIKSANPSVPAAVEQVNMIDQSTSNQSPQYTFDQSEPVSQMVSLAQATNVTEPAKGDLPDKEPELIKPIRIEWMAVIACFWLSGAAVCGGWFVRKACQLKKKIYRCRAGDAPGWMLTVLEQCKAELQVFRDTRIVVQGVLPVPAIMGVFRPILMVPESLVMEKNYERTRHVFMHELMHSKRHDIMAIWLLNALCAVYWFNPLVWLSCRWIHRDMEAACDSMVVEKLGKAHRKCYIETILQFSGRNEFAHVKAAMSLNDGCMKLQQRIRSMYMKKTSKRVKVTVLILTLMMLFAAFTSGCQPTPEKVIVQNKNNDTVAQAIAQSSEEANELHTYTAPETWQDEAHDETKNIDITIDADVVVPVDTWGLYELVPKSATKEDVQKMLKAIVGDTPIYGEETLQSKDSLIEQIAMYKEQKARLEEMYTNGELSEDEQPAKAAEAAAPAPAPSQGGQSVRQLTKEDIQKNIEMMAQMIADLQKKLENAPDEETVVENVFSLDVMFDEDATSEQASANGIILSKQADYRNAYVRGKADLGRDTPASISIEYQTSSYGEYFNLNFVDYDDYEQCFSEGEAYTGQELFKCDIDVNDAAKMAREKVNELGFDYLDIAKTQVSALLDRKRMEGDQLPECFEFIFTRELDGAVATFARGDGVITQEEMDEMENAEYAPRWTASEVTVYVDDSGIIGIKAGATKSEVNRQAYGIELKDFSDIMDIFKQQVFIENAYSGPGDMNKVVNREIHVNEIRLGYMPMPWKDHAEKIIFAPVWDFFGKEITTFEDGIGGDFGAALDENNAYAYDLGNHSLLTINALDGTIINRDY